MKRVILIRHAKSDRSGAELKADFDRPLNARGVSDLKRLHELMGSLDSPPARLLFSTARRARMTAEGFLNAFPRWRPSAVECPELYLASLDTLLGILANQRDGDDVIGFVGHNPGLHELVDFLVPDLIENFPTLAVAIVDCAVPLWTELRAGCGTLVAFKIPKALKGLV